MPGTGDITRLIRVYPDLVTLSRAAADRVIASASAAIRHRGRFSIVLAGGSTPKALYMLLAADARAIDWAKVHVFFGDERCVGPDDKDSNFRTAAESLLSRVPIPQANVRRICGELGPVRAADEYDRLVTDHLNEHIMFDLVVLGMGPDGHTASLFPGRDTAGDASRRAVSVVAPAGFAVPDRVSLTVGALAASRETIVLAVGADKAAMIARAAAERSVPDSCLPIAQVWAASAHLNWMVDAAASSTAHAAR